MLETSNGLNLPLASGAYFLHGMHETAATHLFCKRLFDVVVSATALLACMPLMALIILAIMIDGGPVFFVHQRVCRGGRKFKCFKFRSMRPDAEQVLESYLKANSAAAAEWNSTQKLRYDPRVTKLGRFLRASSLDELPQLLNVLAGSMSLVGPRPVTWEELRRHYAPARGVVPYLMVRPGLTGSWQASGRSECTYAERVALDIAYARNHSFRNDLLILVRTIKIVLWQRGAH